MIEPQPKKLFLLDAYALIFRAYYAFIKNPRISSKGLNTSAVFGFLLTLEEVLLKQKPTHIAVVFDHPDKTFRHELFKDYKANRIDTPEDIRSAVPYIKKIIEAYKIPVIDCPGFEADDIIGTLAKKASEKGFETYMMTPDKDFAQLVSDNVFMFKPSRSGNESVLWGVEDVKKAFCVDRPEQVIDVLALMGDTSDNIPGAPGIGPKTAMKLVSEFGSIEQLFSNTDKLKGRVREIIEEFREQIKISKILATIDQNTPIDFREDKLIMEVPDKAALKELFDELEFKNLGTKILSEIDRVENTSSPVRTDEPAQLSWDGTLFGNEPAAVIPAVLNSIGTTEHNYEILKTAEEISLVVEKMLMLDEICINTKTSGLNPLESELVSIAFSWEKSKGYLILFPASGEEAEGIIKLIKPVLENGDISKVGHNLKFDIQVLSAYNIEIRGALFDTMIAHYLLEPDLRHSKDALADTYLLYSVNHESTSDPEKLKEYAIEDADIIYQLKNVFEPRIRKEGLNELSENIEMPLIRVLADMESIGVRLDQEDLKAITINLRDDIILLEKEIYYLAGTEFNISSPKQLGDVLFIKLKLDDKARLTKTRQFITSEEILQRLSAKHPIINRVLEYRGLKKLLSTYVEALPLLVSKKTGRIHTSFNQAVAATGRLSSNNPNLQNIPMRDERGREIRKAFVPDEGYIFLSADYSQIELRLMAHLSKDANMIADFLSGNDIHAATAAKIFGVEIENVTREMRSRAKTANFGIIYGISSFGLSERLTIGRKEAKDLIDGYFNSYPGVKAYMEESVTKARSLGYVTTMFGRKRYLRDINSRNQVVRGNAERNAINAPIQGSAADIIKIAMIRIHERIRNENLKSKMILQVHDELIFEAPPSELELLREMVVFEMANAVKLDVPIKVDWGTGNNWHEAH